jgi:hypothetical protein
MIAGTGESEQRARRVDGEPLAAAAMRGRVG